MYSFFSMFLEKSLVSLALLCGFLRMVYKANLVMKITDIEVISTGVIANCLLIASLEGLLTPILSENHTEGCAEPILQAVILVAIVISFSIQALILEGVMRLASDNLTLETKQIERGMNK